MENHLSNLLKQIIFCYNNVLQKNKEMQNKLGL